MRCLPSALVLVWCTGCFGPLPDTSYYTLQPPPSANTAVPPTAGAAHTGDGARGAVLRVEELGADAAYDDPRIVYRTTPYKLEYYHYHRWSTAPGQLVSDFLRTGYAHLGHFERVERSFSEDAAVVLGGRVLALEEVDLSPSRWLGRVEVELELRSARTGELLWSRRLVESEPLDERSPEGLARALSAALGRIVRQTAPQLSAIAREEARKQPTDAGRSSAGASVR